MTGEDIFRIIGIIGIVGWIPIWFFFNGIVKVIRAFKGLDDDGYDMNKRITNEEIVSDKEDDE